MHPKNSTALLKAQEILLTSRAPFHSFDSTDESLGLIEVRPGMPISEAFSSSSNLLAAATSFLDRFLEEGMDANEIYGIRFLVDSAKALVDSGVLSVEFGNRQGGEA
jgi:hypothetical protein